MRTPTSSRPRTCHRPNAVRSSRATPGFTLLELVIVLGILAITALVAAPSIAPNQGADVEVGAGQINEAFRFARDEAMRTQVRHGVELDTTNLRVRVFQSTGGTTRLYDVVHPLTRGPYDISLVMNDRARNMTVQPVATWTGSCAAADDIGFDAWGLPRCANDWTARLDSLVVTVEIGGEQKVVGVQAETGRVVMP